VALLKETRLPSASIGYNPLYRQVKDVLVRRLSDGSWQPGQMLPSEPEIAAELGVSPGTVRKALDELTAENRVVRRQGLGTFVARYDEERLLFQFFRMVPKSGERKFPTSKVLEIRARQPTAKESEALRLARSDSIIAIERLRFLDDEPCIYDQILLPANRFVGIERRSDLAESNLYAFFASEYGVSIASINEKLTAIAAGRRSSKHLQVLVGQPLLAIERVAFDFEQKIVEWRCSSCRTDQAYYQSDVR
jgi:GntR family transcriptional regulator